MTKFNWNDKEAVQKMATLRSLGVTYSDIARIMQKQTGQTLDKDSVRLGIQRRLSDVFNIKGGK